MSLDFDNWVYDGPQWDNVPVVHPNMFKTCEKVLRNVTLWIKQYKLDQKFDIVQKQIDQNHKKIQEVESDFNERTKIMESKTSKEFTDIHKKLQQQDEIIKRLEQKLQMRSFQVEEELEMKDGYMQLNKVYSKYFKYKKKNMQSITQIGDDVIQERKGSNARNKQPQVNSKPIINSKNSSVANSQREINISMLNSNAQTIENQQEIDDENFQYDNQYIIWKMINTAIHECYLNGELKKVQEVIEHQEKQLKTEIDHTKVKLDTSNNLISKVDTTIQEVQKMNQNKFDQIFSYNLDKFSQKLERGLEDIEILQQSKILIETLDSKYDEKCNILHSEISYAHKRIDEVRPPIDVQIKEIKSKIEEVRVEHDTDKTSLTIKINEQSRILNEKITSNLEQVNSKIDSNFKENSTQIEQQNTTIKINSTSLNKNITTFRSDIIADLEKLENGLADIFPRIKEFQTMVLEIQKQLIDIAEMEHIKFNENLQQKMSVFITNIWKKADKTESALEKLIDSFLEYNQQISYIHPDNFQLNNNQQLSPKVLDRANSQTLGGFDNLSHNKKEQQQLRHYSMDEGEEFNDDHEDHTSSHYPLIQLKSLNQSNNNKTLNTQESNLQDSPNLNKRPYIRQDKDQLRLKKIQYTNACKEHNISFGKALNMDTSITNNRQSHSSQKAKRSIISQGQPLGISAVNTSAAIKGSGGLLQNPEKITKNPSNEYSQQLAIMYPNKKPDPFNPSKSLANRFYDNKDIYQNQGNISQYSDNPEQIFNQSMRVTASQNRKRAISQNRAKIGNNSIMVFNTSSNQLGESHQFENPSGNSTNTHINNPQFMITSPMIEPLLDPQQSPIINPHSKFQTAKKKECDQMLQKNLLDIKLKILKKIKHNNEQEQHFGDNHFNSNQQSQK